QRAEGRDPDFEAARRVGGIGQVGRRPGARPQARQVGLGSHEQALDLGEGGRWRAVSQDCAPAYSVDKTTTADVPRGCSPVHLTRPFLSGTNVVAGASGRAGAAKKGSAREVTGVTCAEEHGRDNVRS